MESEKGLENMLPKRQLISLIKEHDDLIAESTIPVGAEEQKQSLHQRINNLKEQLDAERMNYTDEQWALLTQIANFESGYSGSAEAMFVGTYDEQERPIQQAKADREKERLQKRWQEVFANDPLEW